MSPSMALRGTGTCPLLDEASTQYETIEVGLPHRSYNQADAAWELIRGIHGSAFCRWPLT